MSFKRTFAATAISLALVAGCSDDGASDPAASPGTTTSAPVGEDPSATCTQAPTLDPVEVEPVTDVESDLTLTSFDGTEIRLHWFPAPGASADDPAPTVLKGPGWSLPGDTDVEGGALFGALGIGAMNDRGYNVLTWDPRGFGASSGRAQVNDPDHEGRDGQAMLDWVATQPEALLDREGDPRVGMVGFSYGGGIQFTLASIDCRVDVLVPGIAWNSLVTSLGKGETLKEGWAGLLVRLVDRESVAPQVVSAYEEGLDTATVNASDRAWFEARGPGPDIDRVNVPTLIVQGTVDTLFTPTEALVNYASLRQRDVPVKMVWFCGGHGTCLTDPGDEDRVTEASMAWLDRYLKGDQSVETGPAIDIVDQDGTRWVADDITDGAVALLAATDGGILELTAEGGSGPLTREIPAGDIVGSLVPDITPAPAVNAVEVAVVAERSALVMGEPSLTLTYSGTAPEGTKPTRLFAQLVDEENELVVGNQVTPIEITLDGAEHTVTVSLEAIAHHLEAGERLTLQLVATTVAYSEPRLGGRIEISAIEVALPTPAGYSAD